MQTLSLEKELNLQLSILQYRKIQERNRLEMKEENKRLIKSFGYALTGIKSAFKAEPNMRIHIAIIILVIIMGFIFKITKLEWIICIILFGLVISAELVNTAIENLTDIAMPEINPNAKLVKDIAAGSVLVMAMVSAIIGLIIFVPKIF